MSIGVNDIANPTLSPCYPAPVRPVIPLTQTHNDLYRRGGLFDEYYMHAGGGVVASTRPRTLKGRQGARPIHGRATAQSGSNPDRQHLFEPLINKGEVGRRDAVSRCHRARECAEGKVGFPRLITGSCKAAGHPRKAGGLGTERRGSTARRPHSLGHTPYNLEPGALECHSAPGSRLDVTG